MTCRNRSTRGRNPARGTTSTRRRRGIVTHPARPVRARPRQGTTTARPRRTPNRRRRPRHRRRRIRRTRTRRTRRTRRVRKSHRRRRHRRTHTQRNSQSTHPTDVAGVAGRNDFRRRHRPAAVFDRAHPPLHRAAMAGGGLGRNERRHCDTPLTADTRWLHLPTQTMFFTTRGSAFCSL